MNTSTTYSIKHVGGERNVFVDSQMGLMFRYVLAGRFPGEGGVVAPGMSCKYVVRFAPDSLGDYEDFIVVETQVEHLLVVPIVARRPPPVLTCESRDNPQTSVKKQYARNAAQV